ncbi:MAG: YicC family protein [Acidobacteriaceae bacterium]|nr:YicC family protein [Acidobacteriaceae bacterium]
MRPSDSSPLRPVRSMTGYALVRRDTPAGELTVSLRSVNHRGLDLHFHQSADFGIFENAVRGLLKQHIARGHVEVRMSLAREPESLNGSYNRDLLGAYLAAFRQASHDFHLDSKPDLNLFLTLPGVFENSHESRFDEAFEPEVLSALCACIESLNDYRQREASGLCAGLLVETDTIEEATRKIAEIRSAALPHFSRKLRDRLQELLGDSGIPDARLAEEAALLSEKSDVQEELTRLMVHTGELRRILRDGGEVGKRLDFLLQEMNRETNTILSKTSGIGEPGLTITNLGLAIKANIERIREQALNLE